MNFDIVDAAGAPVPHSAVHLHHVLLMDNARRDPLCNRAQRFAGSGSERTPISLPGPYACMVGASDRWGTPIISRYDNSMPHQDVMGIVLAYAWQGTQ
jgi:hypothetical protein